MAARILHTLTHNNAVYWVTFSSDGRRLASASLDNTIKLWKFSTGQHLSTLRGHGDGVCTASFAPDGKTLFSASLDKSLRVWNLSNGATERTLLGHQNYITCMAMSADGKSLVSGAQDKHIITLCIMVELRKQNNLDNIMDKNSSG